MSGTVKRVAVRLALEGADQVRTQITAVGETGQRSLGRIQQAAASSGAGFANLRTTIGQAGFQLQDFVVQVQSGTSAMTALSQQGSQFLGAFGPAGAIAGAVLTVGSLAAALLTGRDNAEAFAVSEERLGDLYARNRGIIADLTLETQNLGAARAQAGIIETQTELGRLRLAQDRIEREREAIQRENALAQRARGALDQGLVLQNQQRIDELNQRAQRAGQLADRVQEDLDRLTQLREGFRRGEGLPTPPSFVGAPSPAGGGGRAGSGRLTDAQVLDRFRGARAQSDPLEGLLERYRQQQEAFGQALERGVISEEEFGRAVETSTLRLGEQIQALERAERGTQRVSDATRDLQRAADGVAKSLAAAFEDLVFEGRNFSDVLKDLERNLIRIGNQVLLQPLFERGLNALLGEGTGKGGSGKPSPLSFVDRLFSSVLGAIGGTADGGLKTIPSAMGNAFAAGRITPFARGGVVTAPVLFPMANGMGLMGEAGPEAVMPLRRDRNGRLGVVAQGAAPVTININGVTDAASFRQSQAQILTGVSRAVGRAQRSR